jgi:hypothetical protein
MDSVTRANRRAWDAASEKHVREYDDLLAQAASGSFLNDTFGRTAATSAAAMSTTRSRLAVRWNGSGPSVKSSPPSSRPG